MPADIDPSPITAIARPGSSFNLFATAKPSGALIEVDECAAPNGSYSLSLRLVKPARPPPWPSVRLRSRTPVDLLCGSPGCPTSTPHFSPGGPQPSRRLQACHPPPHPPPPPPPT